MFMLLKTWAVYAVRGLYFGLYRGMRGYGFPKSRAQWELEYGAAQWDYLSGGAERPVQMVVLGYAIHQHSAPAVLDVGCGHGVFFNMVRRFPLSEYHGVDISKEAISRARGLLRDATAAEISRMHFTEADFESFVPTRRYDVIVFNNSLVYAEDPLWALERFASHLAPGGFLVASLCYNPWQSSIWTRIGHGFATVHSSTLSNEDRLIWHVKVLRRREGRAAEPSACAVTQSLAGVEAES